MYKSVYSQFNGQGESSFGFLPSQFSARNVTTVSPAAAMQIIEFYLSIPTLYRINITVF